MPDVGDTATLTLTVAPFDGSTAATAVATSPAGVTATLTPVKTDGGATWTAQLPLTAAGAWQVVWTVTGAGGGVATDTVYALPVGGPAKPDTYATLGDMLLYLGKPPPDDFDPQPVSYTHLTLPTN